MCFFQSLDIERWTYMHSSKYYVLPVGASGDFEAQDKTECKETMRPSTLILGDGTKYDLGALEDEEFYVLARLYLQCAKHSKTSINHMSL